MTQTLAAEVMFRNFFLSSLDRADLSALAPSLVEVSLGRGDPIYEPGETAATVYFPSTAAISVVTVMEDGRSVETSTVGCESAVALLDAATEEEVRSRVYAQVPGTAHKLPAAALRHRLRESPRLQRLFLRHVRANALQAEQHVACNVLHQIDARLAKWLLMTADRVGSSSYMLTQDYMAVMTGSQRTTISASAATLKAAGLITYSRGNLTILHRDGLRKRACECYAGTREQFDDLRGLRQVDRFEARFAEPMSVPG